MKDIQNNLFIDRKPRSTSMSSIVKSSTVERIHVMWSQAHDCSSNMQPLIFWSQRDDLENDTKTAKPQL